MRLLKAQNTNLRNIYGKGVKYDVNQQVIVDSTNTMLVPKGTAAQRPTNPTEGHVRYNTDAGEFEFYQNGAWRKVRYKEPRTIVQQNLGSGDAVEQLFGPLDNGDTDYPNPQNSGGATDILVFVENVFQIYGTNYTLTQNPGNRAEIANVISTGTTTVIETESAHGYSAGEQIYISGVESNIDDALENLNTDDSSSPGSHGIVSIPTATRIEVAVDTSGGNIANYVTGTGFTLLAGPSTGAYFPGWYINFTSPVDVDKPVTVLHNFNK